MEIFKNIVSIRNSFNNLQFIKNFKNSILYRKLKKKLGNIKKKNLPFIENIFYKIFFENFSKIKTYSEFRFCEEFFKIQYL